MRPKHFLLAVTAVAACAVVGAQTKSTETKPTTGSSDLGTVFFKANVGSFKILGGGGSPAKGRLEVSFNGSVLVSGLQGTVIPSGAVREEISVPRRNKKVYFGHGKLIVEGSYSGIQFFGRDVDGVFHGWGLVRLFGEFDRNLNTGEYWYQGGEHKPWGTGSTPVYVPQPSYAKEQTITPKVRNVPSKG